MLNTTQSVAEVIDLRNPYIDTGIVISTAVAIITAILLCQLAMYGWQSYLRPWTKRVLANLRSLPQTDEESFHAFEMVLQGIILCVLGQVFPILVLFGVVPLYYGARKLGWAFLRFRRRNQTD